MDEGGRCWDQEILDGLKWAVLLLVTYYQMPNIMHLHLIFCASNDYEVNGYLKLLFG